MINMYIIHIYICIYIYMYVYIHSFYHLVGGGFGIAVLDIRFVSNRMILNKHLPPPAKGRCCTLPFNQGVITG